MPSSKLSMVIIDEESGLPLKCQVHSGIGTADAPQTKSTSDCSATKSYVPLFEMILGASKFIEDNFS